MVHLRPEPQLLSLLHPHVLESPLHWLVEQLLPRLHGSPTQTPLVPSVHVSEAPQVVWSLSQLAAPQTGGVAEHDWLEHWVPVVQAQCPFTQDPLAH